MTPTIKQKQRKKNHNRLQTSNIGCGDLFNYKKCSKEPNIIDYVVINYIGLYSLFFSFLNVHSTPKRERVLLGYSSCLHSKCPVLGVMGRV